MRKILFVLLSMLAANIAQANASFETLKLGFETANDPIAKSEFLQLAPNLKCDAILSSLHQYFAPFIFWVVNQNLAWGYFPEDRSVLDRLSTEPNLLIDESTDRKLQFNLEYDRHGIRLSDTLTVKKLNDYYFLNRTRLNTTGGISRFYETAYGYCWPAQ